MVIVSYIRSYRWRSKGIMSGIFKEFDVVGEMGSLIFVEGKF